MSVRMPWKSPLFAGIGTFKTGIREFMWDLSNPIHMSTLGPVSTTDNDTAHGFSQVDVDTSTAATAVTLDGGTTNEVTDATIAKYIERRTKVCPIKLYKGMHLRLQAKFQCSNADKSTISFGLLVTGHAAAWSKHSGASPNCITDGLMIRKLGGTGTSTHAFDAVGVEGGANSSAYELITPSVTKAFDTNVTIATLDLMMDRTTGSKGVGILTINGQEIGRGAFVDLPDTVNMGLAYGIWPMHATAQTLKMHYIKAEWCDWINA